MRSKNSTNVRIITSLYRAGLRFMGEVAPDWAAAQAERLFRTPPSREPSEIEKRVLAQALRSYLEIDGEEIAVWRWGQGPKVLLVHGWGGAAGQFHPLVPPLLRAGFSVLAFDAPAHGESSGSLSSLPQFASTLLAVAKRYGPFEAVVAHSMGGAAASLAMVQGFQSPRAVYVAPPADAYAWFRKFSRSLGFSAQLEEETRQRLEERLRFDFSQLNAKVMGPHIETDLLVIHDHQDKEVDWEEGRSIVHHSRHARLLSTEGLGHRRILRDPEVIQTVLEFLQGEVLPRDRVHPDPRCSRCGLELEAAPAKAMCEACEFEFELIYSPIRSKFGSTKTQEMELLARPSSSKGFSKISWR